MLRSPSPANCPPPPAHEHENMYRWYQLIQLTRVTESTLGSQHRRTTSPHYTARVNMAPRGLPGDESPDLQVSNDFACSYIATCKSPSPARHETELEGGGRWWVQQTGPKPGGGIGGSLYFFFQRGTSTSEIRTQHLELNIYRSFSNIETSPQTTKPPPPPSKPASCLINKASYRRAIDRHYKKKKKH